MTVTSCVLVSASWCKACRPVKPEVAATCQKVDVPLTIIDFDEMETEEQASIKHLPLIRVIHADGTDASYHVDTIGQWKELMMSSALSSSSSSSSLEDF